MDWNIAVNKGGQIGGDDDFTYLRDGPESP